MADLTESPLFRQQAARHTETEGTQSLSPVSSDQQLTRTQTKKGSFFATISQFGSRRLKTAGANRGLAGKVVKVAKGADKVVWVRRRDLPTTDNTSAKKAWYTPNRAFGKSREKQLREEVVVYKEMITDLVAQKAGVDPADVTDAHRAEFEARVVEESRLAVGHRELADAEGIEGEYTVEVDRAEGAIDKTLTQLKEDEKIEFYQVLQLDRDARAGIAELHSIGRITGDSKADNTLVYSQEGSDGKVSYSARVSDFGRTVKVGPKEKQANKGNTRTVDPSGKVSMAGDVWASSVNSLQIFSLMLKEPNGVMKVGFRDREMIGPNSKRMGAERFILQHRAFAAVENGGTYVGRIENARRRNRKDEPSMATQTKRQDLMRAYSYNMLDKLEGEGKINSTQRSLLSNLFFRSFDVHPENRPSAEESKKMMDMVVKAGENPNTPGVLDFVRKNVDPRQAVQPLRDKK